MAGWCTHSGPMLALPLDNVDTDQLIPARFMSVPRSEGYGAYLLHDLRLDDTGAAHADFPLNRHPDATILVAGRNFGSGSSREAAVYALIDAGIRAVFAPNFGDIFASNAVNNGLLPALVSDEDAVWLKETLGPDTAKAKIDLQAGTVDVAGRAVPFALDHTWRTKLINGWDDIDLTLRHIDDVVRFKQNRRRTAPWAWPVTASENASRGVAPTGL